MTMLYKKFKKIIREAGVRNLEREISKLASVLKISLLTKLINPI